MYFHTYFCDRCATDLLLRIIFRPEFKGSQELVRHREERALGPAEVPARVAMRVVSRNDAIDATLKFRHGVSTSRSYSN